jgi:acetyltransferase-like isoleucine patch superfamily enzyme
MSLATKIRKGEGPFWGALKRTILGALRFHLPVSAPTRPIFRACYLLHVAAREGLIWALRFFWYEPLFRSQCTSVGAGFRMEKLPYMGGRGRLVIGRGVRLSGKSAFGFSNRAHAEPELIIGDDTFVGHACVINVAKSVRIGRHCLLAGGVRMADFDGHPINAARRRAGMPTPPETIRPIVIGDDVWIGSGASILKGVTVGDRSIVGAGAIVTKDVPPDTIVAGNPARVIKHIDQDETA